ncbi:MAG: tRNA-U20-dihydrouridine synthase [Anaerolineaceae bacterium]|nr:MAG: tRNA-U20-dihydrouridine synthase [Anaerolineaceae bacterium]
MQDYNTVMSEIHSDSASPTFHIAGIPVYGDAILAPMDGFSDWPFRSLCRGLGSAMSTTEFIKSEFLVRAFKRMEPRMRFDETERPVAIQIYGEDADEIVSAALLVQTKRPDIIDLNMGCPAKSVVHYGAGVGLMRTPVKAARILRRLTAALEIPLTVKMRIGWDDCRTCVLLARIAEEAGAAAVAVHARTKEQGYGGEADWDAIAAVKAAVSIPVIGNGDVKTPADIERMKVHTGCEAVMIGRAAVGNPWIFARLDRPEVPPDAVREMVHRHLERSMQFYGPQKGLMIFRKHAMQYMKLSCMPRYRRVQIIQQSEPEKFLALLDEAFPGSPESK